MMPRFRHTGTTNVVMADGHAKSLRIGDLAGTSGYCKYIFSTAFYNDNVGAPKTWWPQVAGGITVAGSTGAGQCAKLEN